MINIKKIIYYLLNSKNRRKNLTIIASLIVVLLILLISMSNAYYNNITSIRLLNAIVGNVDSEYDIVLKIYKENIDKPYSLSDEIPNNNYVYEKYNCINNSPLIYNELEKTINITTREKEYCYIYFSLVNNGE